MAIRKLKSLEEVEKEEKIIIDLIVKSIIDMSIEDVKKFIEQEEESKEQIG